MTAKSDNRSFRQRMASGLGALLLCVAIVGAGASVVLRGSSAEATVYERFTDVLSQNSQLSDHWREDSGVHFAKVNGTAIQYEIGQSDDGVSALLDDVSNRWLEENPLVDQDMLKDLRKKHAGDEKVLKAMEYMERRTMDRSARREMNGVGVISRLDGLIPHGSPAEAAAGVEAKFAIFDASGDISVLGKPQVVVAFGPNDPGSTDYVVIQPTGSMLVENMGPKSGAELEVRDGMPMAPADSIRVLEYEEAFEDGEYRVRLLQHKGNAVDVFADLSVAMEAEGWKRTDPLAESLPSNSPAQGAAHYARRGDWAVLAVEENGKAGPMSMIMEYARR